MKHILLKKVSAIHAIKCNKAVDFEIALESFARLEAFKQNIQVGGSLISVESEIETWKNEVPIVTDADINNLIK